MCKMYPSPELPKLCPGSIPHQHPATGWGHRMGVKCGHSLELFFVCVFFPEFLSLALNYRLKSAALGKGEMGEYQEGGEGNQLEPQCDHIEGGGKDGEVFAQAVLPGMQSSWWGRDPQSSPGSLEGQLKCCPGALLLPGPTAQEGWSVWKHIKKSSRNFPKHRFLVSHGWPFLFLRARVPSPEHGLCPRAPRLEPGQEEAAGAEGDKSHLECANPPPWPLHALMARVPLGLAQLPGGQWAQVSGGQPWGGPGVTREVAQVMSIWIPATISGASQDLWWSGQQEKSQGLSGRCRRQSWG